MGVFGELKNKKKTPKQKKTLKWRRAQRTEAKKKQEKPQLNLDVIQFFSKDLLKNKMKNMKNNVNISNKKRHKLVKRLRHQQRERAQLQGDSMDVLMTEETAKSSKTRRGAVNKISTPELEYNNRTVFTVEELNMVVD